MTEPPPAEVAIQKAQTLLDIGRNRDAAMIAWEGLRSEPENPALMGLVAWALQADCRHSEARQWAERSLSFDARQAWVHDVRARAILDGTGTPEQAVESAFTAVRLDPSSTVNRFTLTRAYLQAGMPAEGESTAHAIRRSDPESELGPLAEAMVEIDRARFLRLRPILAGFAVVVTNGLILVVWGIWWLVLAAKRAGPLRRADSLILEAVRLDPGNAATHAAAAEVAQMRFRYVQSVDSSLAAAAIEAGLVDADELAAKITRRTCLAAIAGFAFWYVWTTALSAYTSETAAGVSGAVIGLAALGAVCWLDRVQTRRLPGGLLRRVRRRWGLPVVASAVALLCLALGVGLVLDSTPVLAVAAFVPGVAVASSAAILLVALHSGRR
ncbi:hypothetical protein FIV07_10125 [Mycobacterium sp. THAF192]|nr:hypothetical protein FIV07_10125 [Mycobacterium sp. THAF192]